RLEEAASPDQPAGQSSTPVASAVTATSGPLLPVTATVREPVLKLLASGGSCRIARAAVESEVAAENALPAGDFELLGLSLDRRQWKGAPPTDADLKHFRGTRTLHTLWVYTPDLGDAAFSFLADNPYLTTV